METISELESRIRDLINHPRKQHLLLKDRAKWLKLCSSLDVIGDTELAMESYLQMEEVSDNGEKYLLLYGILQVLFVQQDAVVHLMESLNLPYSPEQALNQIRDIRNNSTGHPTKRGNDKAFNFIIRVSMSYSAFELMTLYSDGRDNFTSVKAFELINAQRLSLNKALREAVMKLEQEEREHREKHRDKKLAEAFPDSLRYYYEKIVESISWDRPNEFGAMHVELVADAMSKFKLRLKERGPLETYDSVTQLTALIEYPISELKRFFTQPDISKLNDDDAYIFLVFIRKNIDELLDIAKEIDEEYESDQIS